MNKKLRLAIMDLIITTLMTTIIIIRYYQVKAQYAYYDNNQTSNGSSNTNSNTNTNNSNNKTKDTSNYKTDIKYKVLKDYVTTNQRTMIIIGKNNCHYCTKFKPVIDSIQQKYNFDYLYINLSLLTEYEYEKLMDSEIYLPTSCTGKETKNFSSDLGTPTTIFFENGKPYDCLIGYVNEARLETKLKNAKIIQ